VRQQQEQQVQQARRDEQQARRDDQQARRDDQQARQQYDDSIRRDAQMMQMLAALTAQTAATATFPKRVFVLTKISNCRLPIKCAVRYGITPIQCAHGISQSLKRSIFPMWTKMSLKKSFPSFPIYKLKSIFNIYITICAL
jgi:hypothetical protein